MKKILIILITSFIFTSINAQSLIPIKYGVKIGLNIANIKSTPNEGVKNIDNSALIGFIAGFHMEIALNNKWFINPELLYAQKGVAFNYDYKHRWDSILINDLNNIDEYSTTNSVDLGYIVLNPTISYKATDNLALNFGPSISFLINEDYSFDEEIVGQNPPADAVNPIPGTYNSNDLDLGLNLGVSYYITENFFVDANVNTGFLKAGTVNKITSVEKYGNEKKEYNFELNNRGIEFSIAYLF